MKPCFDPGRRTLLLATLAGAPLALLPAAVRGALPADGTESSYGALDLDWHDDARQRPVPVRLYLPANARAGAPVPLLVFSHGIGGSRRGYSYLGSHWAGHGFASLHLQHVGSDRSLWAGNPLMLAFRLREAAQETEAMARVADLRFALDRLLAGPWAARIDATRIVAAGHSYGANTTLLAAGAQVERQGRPLDLRDARLRAAIVLSAPPFHGEGDPARILATVTVPTLHITATEDVIRIPGYYSEFADRLALFDAIGGTRKALAVFAGGSHSMFTDRSGTGGALLNPQVKAATRALSVAFLRTVFDGDDRGLQSWPTQFGSIVSRYTRQGI